MQLTPTDKGSGIAGMALATIGWATLFKLDAVAKILRLDRWIKQEKIFDWIVRNKYLSLLITEIINFSTHGVTQASSVLFACGSTLVNFFVILVFLPIRAKHIKEVSIRVLS